MGHCGHGTGRTLEKTKCTGLTAPNHVARARQLPRGTMTGGNQSTNIRGINRRRKVPVARCPQPPLPTARDPNPQVVVDRSIHISLYGFRNIAVLFNSPGASPGRIWPESGRCAADSALRLLA